MADAIRVWTQNEPDRADFLVAITSITTGAGVTAGPAVRAAGWSPLADEIAAIGGTRDRFNTAASTPGSGYTLFGWRDAEEGEAPEATGPGARLRGAFVPNRRSKLRPVNVNADGPPAERLQQLIARAPADPATPWPLDDDPGARQAVEALGVSAGLGPHPRSAYWLKGNTLDTGGVIGRLNAFTRPADAPYGAADLDRARAQLVRELGWVGNVRAYLKTLSAPYAQTIADAFPASATLADRLAAELQIAKDKAEMQANWFEFVKGLLSLAGGLEEVVFEETEDAVDAVLEVSAAAMEMGAFGYDSRFDGTGDEAGEDPRVRADELAERLREEAEESAAALERMGNVIVSDPAKLEEVGRWGGCSGGDAQGCPAGLEEYATDSGSVAEAVEAGALVLERTLYSDLVPRSFPVWDTGLTGDPGTGRDPDPGVDFDCTGLDSLNSPFYGAPRRAWATSLDELDPAGRASRRRVSILVRRDRQTYSWPSDTVLRRMFAPVDPLDPRRGGLGLSAPDVLRSAESRYEPGVDCEWTR
jgi:hypothetical protein